MDEIDRYYQLLNLQRGASLAEVKRAYRNLALLWHPDRYPHNSPLQIQAEEKIKEINYAYDRLRTLLSDPNFSIPPIPSPPPPPPRRPPSRPSRVSPTPRPIRPPQEDPELPDLIPWGWLTGAFCSYALAGWILEYLSIPVWLWVGVGVACVGLSLLASYSSENPYSWPIASIFAGGAAGCIAGSQAGGPITAIAWGIAGIGLGAIAGSDANLWTALWVVSWTGIVAIAGWVTGAGTGNGLGSCLFGAIGTLVGWAVGVISDALFKVRKPGGIGSQFGFGLGAWLGAWSGAGRGAMMEAILETGLYAIVGAWGAIAVISGVVAQMVAGEKLLASLNPFYTVWILVSISGLGLALGKLLAS
ncbi:MAG: J domain-containing protein [Limnospira sp.]